MRYLKNLVCMFVVILIAVSFTACNDTNTIGKTETVVENQTSDDIKFEETNISTDNTTILKVTETTFETMETNIEFETTVDTTILSEIINKYVEQGNQFYPNIAFADLNNDNINEMFIMSYKNAGRDGFVDIYDVTKGAEAITTLHFSNSMTEGVLYKDAMDVVHYIIRGHWWSSSDNYYVAYYDVTYDSVTVPFCAIPHTWYENDAEFKSEYAVYTAVGYNSEKAYEYMDYGFIVSDENFKGNFALDTINSNGNDAISDSTEIATMIQDDVYNGLEKISDISTYTEKSYENTWDDILSVAVAYYANV